MNMNMKRVDQPGYAIISDTHAGTPVVHGFVTSLRSAEIDVKEAMRNLPASLLVNIRIVSANLLFETAVTQQEEPTK